MHIEFKAAARHKNDFQFLGDGIMLENGRPVAHVPTMTEAFEVAKYDFEREVKARQVKGYPIRAEYAIWGRPLGLTSIAYEVIGTIKITDQS